MGTYNHHREFNIDCHYLSETITRRIYLDSKEHPSKKAILVIVCRFRKEDSAIMGLVRIKLEDCLLCDKSTVWFQEPTLAGEWR